MWLKQESKEEVIVSLKKITKMDLPLLSEQTVTFKVVVLLFLVERKHH